MGDLCGKMSWLREYKEAFLWVWSREPEFSLSAIFSNSPFFLPTRVEEGFYFVFNVDMRDGRVDWGGVCRLGALFCEFVCVFIALVSCVSFDPFKVDIIESAYRVPDVYCF